MTVIDVEYEIRWRESRAELLIRQATDREDEAPMMFGLSSYGFESLETAERYGAEAKQLKEQAQELRRKARQGTA